MSEQPVPGVNIRPHKKFFEHEEMWAVEPGQLGNHVQPQHLLNLKNPIIFSKNGGIMRNYIGTHHPQKSFPFGEALRGIDVVKRYTMGIVNTLAMKEMLLPGIGLIIMGKKRRTKALQKVLDSYVRLCDYSLKKIYWKPEYYCDCAKQIRLFLKTFFIDLGITPETSDMVGKIFATVIEHDDAYRYRIQDILTMVEKNDFRTSMGSTIDYMVKIVQERDNKATGPKFITMAKVLKWAMRVPSIHSAFRMGLLAVNWKQLQLDEIDRYHCTLWTGYKFFGMTDQERIDLWYEIHPEGIPFKPDVIS